MAVKFSPLHRADGSASYSKNGYSVVAAINGPVEVQRKDEIPEEAAIDVVVRPANGVGGRQGYFRSGMSLPRLTDIARCKGKTPGVHRRESSEAGCTRNSASTDTDTGHAASR